MKEGVAGGVAVVEVGPACNEQAGHVHRPKDNRLHQRRLVVQAQVDVGTRIQHPDRDDGEYSWVEQTSTISPYPPSEIPLTPYTLIVSVVGNVRSHCLDVVGAALPEQ